MSEQKPNYFQVLGILRSASDEEIRRAYRQLVLKHHPDRSPTAESKEIFAQAQEAYEVLRDPQRRLNYVAILDLSGKQAPPKPKPKSSKPKPPTASAPKKSTDIPTKTASYRHEKPDPAPPSSQTRHATRYEITDDLVKLTGYLARARFADAEKQARKVIKLAPSQPLPYAVLGDIARMRGDLREATEMYALATQMDPKNPSYLMKYEECLRLDKLPPASKELMEKDPGGATGVMAGSLVAGFATVYVAISNELPMEGAPTIISTWTVGLLMMMLVAGIGVGAGLSVSNHLERFQTGMQSAVMTIPPGAALGMLAALNFWFAAAVYLFVGASQSAFNKSTSRLVGVVALMTLCFSGASLMAGKIDATQTLFWGGNVLYIACLCGWVMADSFKETR